MTIFKKNNTTKETKKLPMSGNVKKGFRTYCAMVLGGALIFGMSTTAFAAGTDPWFWYRSGRFVAEISRPFSESERFPDSCWWCHHHICKGNPYSYHRSVRSNTVIGEYQDNQVLPLDV